jgi:pyruvate kinase
MRFFTTEMVSEELESLARKMVEVERRSEGRIAGLHPDWRASARNLLDYLTLRSRDNRALQEALAERGLSSLGRSEAHSRATLEAVLGLLRPESRVRTELGAAPCVGREEGRRLLRAHAEALLGKEREQRTTRIMVTLPSEAALDRELVRELIRNGMEIARINCAHDDREAWKHMADNVRRESAMAERRCLLMMDLPGPKLRTGDILHHGAVKLAPRRDDFGRIVEPARVCLVPVDDRKPAPGEDAIPVPREWLSASAPGDVVAFEDTRGASRSMTVRAAAGETRWATLEKTAYVAEGTVFELRKASGGTARAGVGPIAARPGFIRVRRGDHVVLTKDPSPGTAAQTDGVRVLVPARIPCTLPEVFSCVRTGETIWFDDGLIRGTVRGTSPDEILVEIVAARPSGEKLKPGRGINLPDSDLRLPALTGQDLADLEFVVTHADLVGMSFVRDPADVLFLEDRLAALGARSLGIVLKIETRQAFQRLPDLLFAAMRWPSFGVMIARGDLAVECGYERLAEVQEEILSIAEAAHAPVIWATQVLEGLAKDGVPSRAEITDAAMGRRAECVMLNKGPHVVEAAGALDDILERMQGHQTKKTAMLRKLRLAEGALAGIEGRFPARGAGC